MFKKKKPEEAKEKKESKITLSSSTSTFESQRTVITKTVEKKEIQKVRHYSVPNETAFSDLTSVNKFHGKSIHQNNHAATYSGRTFRSAFFNDPISSKSSLNLDKPRLSSIFSSPLEFKKPSSTGSLSGSFDKSNLLKTDAAPFQYKPTTGTTTYNSPYRGTTYSTSTPVSAPLYPPVTTNRYQTSSYANPYQTSNQIISQIPDTRLVIDVKKSTKFFDGTSHIPTYKTRSKNRGKVLVINNIKFEDDEKKYRKGAEIDEANIKKLFKEMKFEVDCYTDLNANGMKRTIERFKNNSSLKKYDICVVVIMSHGTSALESTQIAGIDGSLLPTSWIIEQFDNQNCRYLSSKPKIFIFQCCRGKNIDSVSYDSTAINRGRKFEDMLIAYSTVPGYVSHRDEINGTWYIQAICQVFMEHAHNTDVESLLKIVDTKLASLKSSSNSTQTSSFENRGFKTCYFHPKLYE